MKLRDLLEPGNALGMSITLPPPRRYVHVQYGFQPLTLEPGAEEKVSVDLGGRPFRAQKLVMAGFMDAIRGSYTIKRSRYSGVDRDDVVCVSSRVCRWRNARGRGFYPGKVSIEFKDGRVREYLQSSVEYVPVDPLEYIVLRNMFCGREPMMPANGDVTALYFGASCLGNGIPAPTTDQSVTLLLKNVGDVRVKVSAMLFGIGL